MKVPTMSEPVSGTAIGFAGLKALGGVAGIGAGLAAVVVMCTMTPRSPREWAVGIISTVMASMGGGAAVIQHYDLLKWADNPVGLVGVLGLVFACGLPGWAIVRWLFNYIEKNKAEDFTKVVNDVRGVL